MGKLKHHESMDYRLECQQILMKHRFCFQNFSF